MDPWVHPQIYLPPVICQALTDKLPIADSAEQISEVLSEAIPSLR